MAYLTSPFIILTYDTRYLTLIDSSVSYVRKKW